MLCPFYNVVIDYLQQLGNITFLILYFLLNHIYLNMYVHVKFYFSQYIYCSLLLYQVLTCPILAQKASSSQGLQLSSANLVADILTPVQVIHLT